MSCSWKLRSMSWRRLASLAPFTARDTLDLAMPALAAIAGSTRAYLRVDTPDTRISLIACSQPAIALQLLVKGNGYFTPAPPTRAQPRLAHFEPPLQQANLSTLAAVPEHLSTVTSWALVSRDTAGRQLQQQLDHRTPGLVHHRLDRLLAARNQIEHRCKQLGALRKVGQQPVVIISTYHGELRFLCCILGSTLHLAGLLSRVSWLANPILSDSPGKPPPSTFN